MKAFEVTFTAQSVHEYRSCIRAESVDDAKRKIIESGDWGEWEELAEEVVGIPEISEIEEEDEA